MPVSSADDDPVAVVQGFGPDVPWREVMRAARSLIRDGSAVGAPQHRPDRPDRARHRRPGNGALVRAVATSPGVEPDRGRQAGAAAVRRDPPPGGRRAPARGRRPARHRHRGRPRRGRRLAAGDDRRDRLADAGAGPAADCGRRTRADLARPARGASRRPSATASGWRRAAGRATVDGRSPHGSSGDGRRRATGGGSRCSRGAGGTSTSTGRGWPPTAARRPRRT